MILLVSLDIIYNTILLAWAVQFKCPWSRQSIKVKHLLMSSKISWRRVPNLMEPAVNWINRNTRG